MATETTSPSLHPIPTLSFGAFFFSLLSGEADAEEAATLWLGLPSSWLLLGLLMISSAVILGVPIWKAKRKDRTAWPETLMREEPNTRFYPFELFVNVFPPWQPGTKNPVQLPEKKYGFGTEPSDKLRAADHTMEGMSKPPKEVKDERGGSKEKKDTKKGADGAKDPILVSEDL